MVERAQLLFTGYNSSNVKTAVAKIVKQSSAFHVTVHGTPMTQKAKPVKGQPKLWGCGKEDVANTLIIVSGSLNDVKKLVKVDTPNGVQIELLPSKAK